MNKEEQAIEMLMLTCRKGGCTISDSGGKDSGVIKHLALKAHLKYGLQIKIRHNHTTVDAPETVYFIREQKKKFEKAGIQYDIQMPKESMFQLIVRHGMPPTRIMRYCCRELKECSGMGEKLITGVRKAESQNRKRNHGIITFPSPKRDLKAQMEGNENFHITNRGGVVILNLDNADTRRVVENCYRTNKTLINPIVDWSDEDVWKYTRDEKLDVNPCYETGQLRCGCIGCPMAGKARWKEFAMYPKYKDYYIHAFDKMLAEKRKRGSVKTSSWTSGKRVFQWWMEDKNIAGQMEMEFENNKFSGYREI